MLCLIRYQIVRKPGAIQVQSRVRVDPHSQVSHFIPNACVLMNRSVLQSTDLVTPLFEGCFLVIFEHMPRGGLTSSLHQPFPHAIPRRRSNERIEIS